MINNSSWETLTLPFDKNVREALLQQHQAAQFIAIVGRHLIPQQADDGNTNMQYLPDKEMLIGNALPNGFRLGLQLTDFEFHLLDNNDERVARISLTGKTRIQVFAEIKKRLTESGIETSKLRDELHYEIPKHAVSAAGVFTGKGEKFFKENMFYRHNGEIVLNAIISEYKDADPVRIWPHHFDTGTTIPLNRNDKGGVSKSLGLGLAIPDSMVDEPYFYLSFWSEDPSDNIGDLPPLDCGEWMTPGWNGAVLRLSEILKNDSAQAQYQFVKAFFKSGLAVI